MKKILFAILAVFVSVCVFSGEIGTFDGNGEKYMSFCDGKLTGFKPHRVSDRSKEVYFTNDKFGVGITNKGEFTLNSDDKRLNYIGMSGIILFDRKDPKVLYRADMKKITKEGFEAKCEALGVTLDFDIVQQDISIRFKGAVTGAEDRDIVICFAFPVDGTTALEQDRQVWIYDFFKAVFCEAGNVYSNPHPVDSRISRYPFGAVMTRYISLAMARSPRAKAGKFVFYKDLKTFVNQYDLSLKKDTPEEIEFDIFKYSYLWGFRGVYDRYITLYSKFFEKPSEVSENEITEVGELSNQFFENLLEMKAYKVKGPVSDEDICFLKCAAFQKDVYYETDKETFECDYPKAVFYGFIPVAENPGPKETKIISSLKNVYDTVRMCSWNICPDAESNNENVISEKYVKDDDMYVLSFNKSDIRRVAFLEIFDYFGGSQIENLADNSSYPIKNRIVDIVYNPYGLSLFHYKLNPEIKKESASKNKMEDILKQ